MSDVVDPHAMAGAYVLDAVDDTERAAFERHLAGCAACADEVAGLRETAVRLSEAVALAPPAGHRDAVLAAVVRTSQVRPTPHQRSTPAAGRGAGHGVAPRGGRGPGRDHGRGTPTPRARRPGAGRRSAAGRPPAGVGGDRSAAGRAVRHATPVVPRWRRIGWPSPSPRCAR
jgi:anti-sigma factor RsiW